MLGGLQRLQSQRNNTLQDAGGYSTLFFNLFFQFPSFCSPWAIFCVGSFNPLLSNFLFTLYNLLLSLSTQFLISIFIFFISRTSIYLFCKSSMLLNMIFLICLFICKIFFYFFKINYSAQLLKAVLILWYLTSLQVRFISPLFFSFFLLVVE